MSQPKKVIYVIFIEWGVNIEYQMNYISFASSKTTAEENTTTTEANYLRLFQHTFGTHPFRNLSQQAISRDSFHSWRCRGIGRTGVRYRGVLQFSWKLDRAPENVPKKNLNPINTSPKFGGIISLVEHAGTTKTHFPNLSNNFQPKRN